MIQPIPKRLLPHKAIYKEYLGNTGEGDEWSNDISLSFIKIEKKLQFRVNNNGRELVGNARMYYDLVNSTGLTKEPVVDSKVIFEGHEYKIVDFESLCPDNSRPHHYEVILK